MRIIEIHSSKFTIKSSLSTLRPGMNVRFIINPLSGKGRKQRTVEKRVPRDAAVSMVYSEYRGHTKELARQAVADGMDRVIAVGGDGTVNEVGQELIGTRVALGIVPCGSGNGLARHLRLPSNTRRAVNLALHGPTRLMDTGTANGFPFLNVMGIGFDAEISEQFNRLARRGAFPYFLVGLRTFRRWKPFRYSIETPDAPADRSGDRHAWQIAVANASQYGNNAVIAPGADIADGLLDCVTIRPASLPEFASLAVRLFARNLNRHPAVTTSRSSRLLITRENEGWMHTDGESHWTGKTIDIRILPGSLNVVTPPGNQDRVECGSSPAPPSSRRV